MRVERGQIWWVDYGLPFGSEPGKKRPVLVVQSNAFNDSRIATVIVVALTSNLQRGDAPGNVTISKKRSGLPSDSVINVSQLTTIDRRRLIEHHASLGTDLLQRVEDGLRRVLAL